jgi:DNA-binding NarL/FixJ family response regulator
MAKKTHLNIVVLSSNTKALVRIKPEIDRHQGGFTVADKTSLEDLFKKVDWAIEGVSYTKDVKEIYTGELRPEWYRVLELGSQGMTDKEIAMQINVAERTVWSYWHKIRDVFGIYPEAGDRSERKKIQTLAKARELGFLD